MRNIKHLLILALLGLVLLGSCTKKQTWNLQINGRLTNAPTSTYARLYLALPTGNKFLDSTALDREGSFTFRQTTHGKNFYVLTFTNSNYNIYLLADSGQTIYVTADYKDLLNTYQVKGSPESQLIQQLEQHLAQTRHRLDSLTFLYENLVDSGEKDSAKIVDSLIQQVIKSQKLFSTHFVLKHKNSLVALPALSQVYTPGKPIFDPENDAQLYFMVDSELSIHYPKNLHVLRLHSFVQNIKLNLRRHQFTTNNIMPGSKAPGIHAKTIDGQAVSLSDYRGKYVYLLFTSSWCQDCEPVVSHAQSLTKNNLVKIAVLLDIDRDTARTYAHEKLQGFKVICDGRFWNSPIVKAYHVTRLPSEVLISPDGKIIALGKEARRKIMSGLH